MKEKGSLKQIQVKQLKNRYNDPTMNKRFIIGVDRSKMKLYDVDSNSTQSEITDSGQDNGPVFDNTDFGKGDKYDKFSTFKV